MTASDLADEYDALMAQVVAVADTLREAMRILRQVEPDPTRTQCFNAEHGAPG